VTVWVKYIDIARVSDDFFPGDLKYLPSFTRAKRWQRANVSCAGQWIRRICNIGAGDLPWIVKSKHMFLNKIRMEDNQRVFRCLEMWYTDRVNRPGKDMATPNGQSTFDVRHYANLPFVIKHV
jgi:hypothetical protein